MRTFGTATLKGGSWHIEADPHVAMRMKRLFKRSDRGNPGKLTLSHSPEVAADLEWFCSRYPLEVHPSPEAISVPAREFHETILRLEEYLADDYEPKPFEMELPPRTYQAREAEIVLAQGYLLIADEVGLGKTASSLAVLSDPRTRPAVVACPTHLPRQWAQEATKFLPDAHVHIVKKGTPYPIESGLFGAPDIYVVNYAKLPGWAPIFAKGVKTVVFDEIQALRTGSGTLKYEAAKLIAKACEYRIGLSVGPESIVELRGGPFGNGWVGAIEEAWGLLRRVPIQYADGYEIQGCGDSGVQARGWSGVDGFAWKPVHKFIRHGCDRPVREVSLGATRLVATDDHSVFLATEDGLREARAEELTCGDIVPVDDGAAWSDGATESPLDVAELAKGLDRAQINVDLSCLTRQGLGLTAWQWQNCHREATYGTRIPVPLYMQHREKFAAAGNVYIGRGKAAAAPSSVLMSQWAYILGFYLGDGWVSQSGRVCFAVENERVPDIVRRLRDLPLGLRPKVRKMRGESSEVRCTHKIFAKILEHVFNGARCHEKAIPGGWIVSWPEAARRALVAGMVDSDGHVAMRDRNRSTTYYTTSSEMLAQQVVSLLRSLGVRAGLSVRRPQPGGVVDGRRIVGRRQSYQVHWSTAQLEGNTSGKRGHQKRYPGRGFNEARVTGSKRMEAPDYVYDLEMDGHPSFVANGLLVHNSATPIYNYGGEVYNVLNILKPGLLGTWGEFVSEWCVNAGGIGRLRYKLREPRAFGTWARETFAVVRHSRSDVGRELPDVVKIVQTVDSDPAALDAVEDRAAELARILLSREKGERGEKMRAAEELSNAVRQATGISKATYVAEFVRLLVESGEAVVLCGWHHAVYDIWEEKLRDLGVVRFTGTENAAQKENAKQRFVKGEAQVMLLSLRSGEGLNDLQLASSCIVFGELDWSPGIHEQCVGRLQRDGQTNKVVAYFLTAEGGSDPLMIDVLGVKREQVDGIRDPAGDLVERLESGEDRIRKLAELYLAKRGETTEQAELQEATA